jgi:hypothetical protein
MRRMYDCDAYAGKEDVNLPFAQTSHNDMSTDDEMYTHDACVRVCP